MIDDRYRYRPVGLHVKNCMAQVSITTTQVAKEARAKMHIALPLDSDALLEASCYAKNDVSDTNCKVSSQSPLFKCVRSFTGKFV